MELSKQYQPKEIEEKWAKTWIEKGYAHADVDSGKEPYTIVIPPPNVTGVLHMGHALNNTIQDILIRFHKMKGFNTLWMPGVDHAGIATQNVVEKALKDEGKHRGDLGREAFLERVWDWKQKHGDIIIDQLKKLGASCDWERQRFTMDEGMSYAVRKAFVDLYNDDLIYRGHYIINWCPRCGTALSDEEAEHQTKQGKLYHIRYQIENTEDAIVVATTRPETLFGDTAVAVNPDDDRYKHLHGKQVVLPLNRRLIPIICDKHVDPEFGTGLVKVTPAHDPNDFEIGQRHSLQSIDVMMPDGTMTNTGAGYDGLDRFICRKQTVKDLEGNNLIAKIEDHEHSVGHCYRCDTVVEPRLSEQWFVRMKPLAEKAIEVVEKDDIRLHPERWKKIYLDWLNNIRDWCISRQIWWGHRIPVWTCEDCHQDTVAMEDPTSCSHCSSSNLKQDEDVLDTWFSSWLWPISTMGWPEETKELEKFYPTNTLSTAPEILFFWVARMIMSGLYFKGEIPFRDVYLHGTVRDDTGRKMSKSLKNTIDPLEVIDKYSADALRFSLMMITSSGQDVYLSMKKFEIGRNFSNKIWNAARFLLMKMDGQKTYSLKWDTKEETFIDRWILSRLHHTIAEVSEQIDMFKCNEAARSVYDFFWHDFCDWYLEMIKPHMDEDACQQKLLVILQTTLRLLHPFMPFISEELWQYLAFEGKTESLMLAQWPEAEESYRDPALEEQCAMIQDLIQAIRNVRKEFNVAPSQEVAVQVVPQDENTRSILSEWQWVIQRLAKVSNWQMDTKLSKPEKSSAIVREYAEIFIPLADLIDPEQELARLNKDLEKVTQELDAVTKKLANKEFTHKAPQHVVQKQEERQKELITVKEKLVEQLAAFAKS